LVAERRISPGEINRYLSDINREISSLESRLNSLRGAAGSGGASYGAGGAAAPARRRGRKPGRPRGSKNVQPSAAAATPSGAGASTGRRRGRPPGRPSGRGPGRPPGSGASAGGKKRRGGSALTPEQLASRQLQGRYLGLIRQIPASRRGQYQKTAKEKGREAAIKEMQETLKK